MTDPAKLTGRAVINVGGPHRLRFLDGLLTQRVDDIGPGEVRYGALLTPQGKVVTDMFVFAFSDFVQLDVPVAAAADLMKRLTMYRLRANVTLDMSEECVAIGGAGPSDPRHGSLGTRAIVGTAADDPTAVGTYHRARYAAGVPDAALDFTLGAAFAHDANMDLFHGIDFEKGCFVGQEVVSRMRHRGTARRRTVRVVSEKADLPAIGTPLTVNDQLVGEMGSSLGAVGLATVRIDKAGLHAMAGTIPVTLHVPDSAPFALAGAVPAA